MKYFSKKNLINYYLIKPLIFVISSTSVFLCAGLAHANNQWQPIASDTLIKLPAKVIHQRINDDFSSSPLAQKLHQVEQSLTEQAMQIKALQQLSIQATAAEQANIDLDIVEQKSSYLSLLKESHELRQQALDKRQTVYETILSKINEKASQQIVGHSNIKAAQKSAVARMEKSKLKVEQWLNQYQNPNQVVGNVAQYEQNYQTNLNKINQLKATLAAHRFNAKSEIDGVAVSDQEYIRTLLMKLATERSLLNQENTMLAYMTRLVTLDAESLTAQLAQTTSTSSVEAVDNYSRAEQATELFIEGEYHE